MASVATIVSPEDVQAWGQQLDSVVHRIASRFARSEARRRVRAYLIGLLGPVQRKNSWQLAEQVGDESPDAVRHLLGRPHWDPDEVRDDLRAYAVGAPGDPDAVLTLDETGSLKKGKHSAGVARQYAGTAGRIGNARVGVSRAYAGRHGTAFLDRALYLPEGWADDPARCEKAGIPGGTAFATKAGSAGERLARAFEAGGPAAWVTGDEVDGSDGELRRRLETEGRPSVPAVRENRYVWRGLGQPEVGALAKAFPKRARHTIRIARGCKGPRRYARAWPPMNHDPGPKWRRWLLVRRSLAASEELAYYLAAGPKRTTLTRSAVTAGARWPIEGGFEAAKQGVGLAGYEVRSRAGWHRHVTLALLAHAILSVVRTVAEEAPKKSRRTAAG